MAQFIDVESHKKIADSTRNKKSSHYSSTIKEGDLVKAAPRYVLACKNTSVYEQLVLGETVEVVVPPFIDDMEAVTIGVKGNDGNCRLIRFQNVVAA